MARIRKEKGYTQVELATRMGIAQTLVSDYERDKFRPHAEMIIRFAVALEVSADELLGLTEPKKKSATPGRRILRRLEKIEKLPKRDQDALIRTIDAFLGKAS